MFRKTVAYLVVLLLLLLLPGNIYLAYKSCIGPRSAEERGFVVEGDGNDFLVLFRWRALFCIIAELSHYFSTFEKTNILNNSFCYFHSFPENTFLLFPSLLILLLLFPPEFIFRFMRFALRYNILQKWDYTASFVRPFFFILGCNGFGWSVV